MSIPDWNIGGGGFPSIGGYHPSNHFDFRFRPAPENTKQRPGVPAADAFVERTETPGHFCMRSLVWAIISTSEATFGVGRAFITPANCASGTWS